MDIFVQQYFDLSVMRDNFGSVALAFLTTLKLALFGTVLSLVWGLTLALLRGLPGKAAAPVRALTVAYIDALRGLPLLLLVLLMSGSVPFLTFLPEWVRRPQLLGEPDVFWFGVASLALMYGAYYAEVFRAGIEAVPRGQDEAARSLGMGHALAMRHVVVPQAIRKVVPPMLNDFTALLKDTSLVQVVGVLEVVRAGREVQAETFNSSALMLGALFFLAVTVPLARVVDRQIRRQQLRYLRS